MDLDWFPSTNYGSQPPSSQLTCEPKAAHFLSNKFPARSDKRFSRQKIKPFQFSNAQLRRRLEFVPYRESWVNSGLWAEVNRKDAGWWWGSRR